MTEDNNSIYQKDVLPNISSSTNQEEEMLQAIEEALAQGNRHRAIDIVASWKKNGVHPLLKKPRITGINHDLFCWACESNLYKSAIGNTDQDQSWLANALDPDQNNRYIDSVNLMMAVWAAHTELGLAPNYNLLTQYEYHGAYYEKYRDHVTHMFKVFLLGLYLFENHDKIRNAILDAWKEEEVFLSIWILTALWHDVGYLIETEEGTRDGEGTLKTLKQLDEILSWPLTNLFGEPFDKDSEERWQEMPGKGKLKIPRKAKTIVALEEQLVYLCNCGSKFGLTVKKNCDAITKYYMYTASKKTTRSFFDHGIISACMLLYVRDELCKYIMLNEEMYENQKDEINGFLQKKEKYWLYAQTAAEAIAIHNLRKPSSDHGVTELKEYGVSIKCLRIRLEQEPIAYLLRLCDELQCWDRQRFDPPKDYSISGALMRFKTRTINDERQVIMEIDDTAIKNKVKESVRGIFSPDAELFLC